MGDELFLSDSDSQQVVPAHPVNLISLSLSHAHAHTHTHTHTHTERERERERVSRLEYITAGGDILGLCD